jgi:peptidyl-tRNA hydrolase
MKMYILIRESIPPGNAMVAAAHASLVCYLKFTHDPRMVFWLSGAPGGFRKVVCRVTDKEFELAKQEPDHVVITESTLNDAEVALVFCPRDEYPKRFMFFRKWN